LTNAKIYFLHFVFFDISLRYNLFITFKNKTKMNTTKKIKGKMIAAIITFAATIFTGCVPTPGGGGTTPSGTFNVGLFLTNSQEYMAYWDNNSFINSKKIYRIISRALA